MDRLINISDWQSGNNNLVPIGKRIKKVVYHPKDDDLYYFKEPKEKYPWEFWNEIIAYKIGIELGFDVLEYKPAILEEEVGCLSPSMTKSDEELIHGQQFLTQILPSFETKKGIDHNFQLIKSFFESNEKYYQILSPFVEMLVFDAIIGNRDRHQQNWALIRKIDVKSIKQSLLSKLKKDKLKFKVEIVEQINFSKLFDNGNCLAYNITEENINSFLNDQSKIEKYLFGEKATSHVRWDGKCIPHLELLSNISIENDDILQNVLKRVKQKYSEINISNIVNTIDNGVIFANKKYILSTNRKQLITLLLETRIKKLFSNFLE